MGHSVVLGIDPGKTTGVFAVHIDQGVQRWQLGHDLYPNHGSDIYSWVRREIDLHDEWILIAVERFVITAATAKRSRQPEAIEVLGSLRDQVADLEHVSLVTQTSSEAKRFVADDMLKELGWYAKGQKHANDAARHVLLALARHEPLWYNQLMENVIR